VHPVSADIQPNAGRVLLSFPGQTLGEWGIRGRWVGQETCELPEEGVPSPHGFAGRGHNRLVRVDCSGFY
jgi:hypothetical protein